MKPASPSRLKVARSSRKRARSQTSIATTLPRMPVLAKVVVAAAVDPVGRVRVVEEEVVAAAVAVVAVAVAVEDVPAAVVVVVVIAADASRAPYRVIPKDKS